MKSASKHDWRPQLQNSITALNDLNSSTEGDFLTIGGKLAEFSTAARQISSDLEAVGELISGSQGRQASRALDLVLERSRRAEEQARAGGEALTGVCGAARRIEHTFRGFRETVSMFQVLGSLTRIETARLGDAGVEFGALAEAVQSLTQRIASSGLSILEASSQLQENMQSALARVAGLRDRELKELPALTTEVITSMRFLEDRQQQAMAASRRQAAEYGEVSGAIEDLITAVQFHDITRQRVEHVSEALGQLGADIPGGGSGLPGSRALAVIKLQDSQLADAANVFATSAGRIGRDLGAIAERVHGMAGAARTLMGLSTDEQDSFFAQLEARFAAILKNLDACGQAEVEIRAALSDLEGAVHNMWEAVAEVCAIEISIRRLALNAAVRAEQIGGRGHALSVLAEVMQRLAADASGITTETGAALDAIAEAGGSLSHGDGATSSQTEGFLPGMRSTVAELHAANETCLNRMGKIAALSSRLGDEIQSVRAGFQAGKLFAETAGHVRAALAEIGEHCGAAYPDQAVGAPKMNLGDLQAHYTMQAERDVHATLTALEDAGEPAVAVAAVSDAGGEDFGDNVELF